MRSSMVFGSLILLLLLLATTAHGLRRLDMHAARNKKEEIQADVKWQLRPSSSGSPGNIVSDGRRHGGMTPEDHASTGPTLVHEDYAGPSGHSPNHHRTIRCGPC